jgi:hypothetical protein
MEPPTTDHSVLTALAELRALEEQRIADEHAEAARRLAAQQSAEARARAEAEETRRRAEVAAQRRDDEEAQTRAAEAARRVAALRAELDAVQADRARLHGAMLAAVHDVPAASGNGLRAATAVFAGCALLAAGLAVGLALRPAAGGGVAPTAAVESVSATRESATALPAARETEMAAGATSADSRDGVSVDGERDARGDDRDSEAVRVAPRASVGEQRNGRQRNMRERADRERGGGRGDGRGGERGGGNGDGLEVECDEDDPTCGM